MEKLNKDYYGGYAEYIIRQAAAGNWCCDILNVFGDIAGTYSFDTEDEAYRFAQTYDIEHGGSGTLDFKGEYYEIWDGDILWGESHFTYTIRQAAAGNWCCDVENAYVETATYCCFYTAEEALSFAQADDAKNGGTGKLTYCGNIYCKGERLL